MRTQAHDATFALGLGLAAWVIFAPPSAAASAAGVARFANSPSPVERAMTGGLAVLRAPASTMIRVAASRFVIGSTPDEVGEAVASCRMDPLAYRCSESTFSSELPREIVSGRSFWLDRSEVTVGEYARCVERGACEPRLLAGGARRFNRPELPVTFVSASDAAALCNARSARLPTEREFERAARGTQGRHFPWGNLYNSHLANHGRLGLDETDASDGYAELAPVGSFPAGRTPDGFLDLAGNASEWTNDLYTERLGAPADPAWSGARVVRGGDYLGGAAFLRGAARRPLAPNETRPNVGFRCARSVAGTVRGE